MHGVQRRIRKRKLRQMGELANSGEEKGIRSRTTGLKENSEPLDASQEVGVALPGTRAAKACEEKRGQRELRKDRARETHHSEPPRSTWEPTTSHEKGSKTWKETSGGKGWRRSSSAATPSSCRRT